MSCQWITAHSGCEGTPENSVLHIRAAVQSGADVLEVDVRRGKTGFFLSHDPAEQEESCVSLADCFRLTKELSPAIRVNCDLKEDGLELAVLRLAEEMGLAGRIILTGTVAPEILARLPDWAAVSMNVENLLPGFYRELRLRPKPVMTGGEEEALLARARECGATSLNMHYGLFHEELYNRMTAAGLRFSLWTVNEEAALRELMRYDLENITTRIPAAACSLRAKLERSASI